MTPAERASLERLAGLEATVSNEWDSVERVLPDITKTLRGLLDDPATSLSPAALNTIVQWLNADIPLAAANGADSRSMPDEFVEIAGWLCGVPAARDKFDDVLLPFLALMRKELHANTGKGDRPGWLKMDANTALLEIVEHVAKLYKAVHNNDGPRILEHAADIANAAMMTLDVCGGLGAIEGNKP